MAERDSWEKFDGLAPEVGWAPTAPVLQYVQAITIQRASGVGLLIRVLPGGSWRLREYDCNGDEEGRGDA